MQLYLIRHAQSQNNALPESQRVEDPGITEVGQQQARYLADRVAGLGLTKLFTSPFRRTLQTAGPIHQATALTPEVRSELHEMGGCYRGHTPENITGRPGMSRAEIESEFPGYCVSPEIDGQGWWGSKPRESEALARRRAERLLQQSITEFGETDQRVAFIMHADIKLLLLQQFHFEWLDVPYNTSVSAIRITPTECVLEDYNCTRHLPADLVTH